MIAQIAETVSALISWLIYKKRIVNGLLTKTGSE